MNKAKKGFTLVELLVVIAIIGVLVALLLPAIQAARSAARRAQSFNNLKQLSLAVHGYMDSKSKYPGNGIFEYGWYAFGPPEDLLPRPDRVDACGWIYKVLPYMEYNNLYENWVFDVPIPVLLDPSRPGSGLSREEFNTDDPKNYWQNVALCGPVTDYAANMMVIGNGMATKADSSGNPVKNPAWANNPGAWDVYKQNQVEDGTSNTVMIGTKALPPQMYDDRGPGDFTLSNGSLRDGRDHPITVAGSHHFGTTRAHTPDTTDYMAGSLVGSGMAKYYDYIPGEEWALAPGWPAWYQFSLMIYPDSLDVEPFNAWGSPYPAGGLFAMCDGSVRSFSFDIDYEPWVGLLTPHGGEVVVE
ncbi:MAG: DUF1559 domain-containing protein [Planctomycetota bacterium]